MCLSYFVSDDGFTASHIYSRSEGRILRGILNEKLSPFLTNGTGSYSRRSSSTVMMMAPVSVPVMITSSPGRSSPASIMNSPTPSFGKYRTPLAI